MSFFTNENGLFQKCFGFLGKLIAINLLWMLCSLPLITIGASTTALFYTMLKLHKEKDCSVRDYFKSFRQNAWQATGVWVLLCSIAAALLLLKNETDSMPGMLSQLFEYGVWAISIPLVLITLFIFPTIAAFENKARILVANAFFFSIKRFFLTVCIAAITLFPMFFTMVDGTLFPIYLFVWILCGFSLTAYANSWFFYKLFRPYLEDEIEEDICMNGQNYVA